MQILLNQNNSIMHKYCAMLLRLFYSHDVKVNVKKDLESEKSVYRFYQELLELRAENDAFQGGSVEVLSSPEDDFFIYTRSAGDEKWVVICNFEKEQRIELPFECEPPALANLGRTTAAGRYISYECAAARISKECKL